MANVQINIAINASPSKVWEELRHIERHVNWMQDAVSIEFQSDQREGVGTKFECLTKIGPFQTRDLMSITSWEENHLMGVTHEGLVTGSGSFTLSIDGEGSEIMWRETLRFPWWGLGSFGAYCAKPVFILIWKKNLTNLKRIVESMD